MLELTLTREAEQVVLRLGDHSARADWAAVGSTHFGNIAWGLVREGLPYALGHALRHPRCC